MRTDVRKAPVNPLLKFALELGPLMVFFFVNLKGARLAEIFPALSALGAPIFMATAAFMVAMALSLVVSFVLMRSLPIMPLITGVVVLVFGGLTLYLQNDTFIKMKPTIVNLLFGGTLLAGLAFGKSLLAYVFDSAFQITETGWKILTFRWALFFLFLALLNEVVWRTTSTDFWVAFKVWGVLPITLIFAFAQVTVLSRHALPETGAPEFDGAREKPKREA